MSEAPAWLTRAAERIETVQEDVEGAVSVFAAEIEEIVLEELTAEEPPITYAQRMSRQVREAYGLTADVFVCEDVTLKITVLRGQHGGVELANPCIMHEFIVKDEELETHVVAKVCFISTPETLRNYAKLAFDAARNAADSFEIQENLNG